MSQTRCSCSILFLINKNNRDFLAILLSVILLKILSISDSRHVANKQLNALRNGPGPGGGGPVDNTAATKNFCIHMDKTLRARHKACFLRPDTGPCRADIMQYYFDVHDRSCYRFWWGGCQGNGNRFETHQECRDYCYLNSTSPPKQIPNFCQIAFDYGSCFGHYNRWAFDRFTKTCRRRLYSGCGGNQNNFQTLEECHATCVAAPSNTMNMGAGLQLTTCIPLNVGDIDE